MPANSRLDLILGLKG